MPQDAALGEFSNHYPIDDPISDLVRKAFIYPGDTNLYATHPSQSAKKYHLYDTARYDHSVLDGRDEECVLSRIGDARPGARPRPR